MCGISNLTMPTCILFLLASKSVLVTTYSLRHPLQRAQLSYLVYIVKQLALAEMSIVTVIHQRNSVTNIQKFRMQNQK